MSLLLSSFIKEYSKYDFEILFDISFEKRILIMLGFFFN